MVSVVAEVGSLFPRVRASICKSCRQKAHRTVAGARFALEHVEKLSRSELFWKMGLAKCARDCSESSISRKNRNKLWRLELFWKMGSEKCARDCSESSV